MRNSSDKSWAVLFMPVGLRDRHFETLWHNFTSISTISPQFENNPSIGYGELIQTKYGQKGKKKNHNLSKNNESPHFVREI